MTHEEIIQLALELIQRPSSPMEGEHAVADWIAQTLRQEGINVQVDHSPEGRPNVLAILEGQQSGKTLLMNGHTDVVPPGEGWIRDPWKTVRENGRLYGRGSADMKGGLAAMLAAAIALQRHGCPFRGRLALLMSADEERSNIGIKHFVAHPIHADYVVIGEPTELIPCVGHKGDCRVRISTTGTSGHCAVVERPDNALYKLARAITALEELGAELGERISPVGRASLTVTMAGAGCAPNIVPHQAWLELDRRILPGESKEMVLREIRERVQAVVHDPFQMESYLFFPAFTIPSEHELVEAASQCVQQTTSRKPAPQVFAASTEAPFFSVDLGYPTIILGPGSLDQAHRPDEFVQVEQLIQAEEVYRSLILKLLA